jgi:hypothetical protein
MLKVNLDHILLLRLDALCLKIAIMAMLVYVTICLPIYFFAQCADVPLGEVDMSQYPSCNITLSANDIFSSYSRFTLANVPDLTNDVRQKDYHLASFQLYLVSMSTWLVCWYACFGKYFCWRKTILRFANPRDRRCWNHLGCNSPSWLLVSDSNSTLGLC